MILVIVLFYPEAGKNREWMVECNFFYGVCMHSYVWFSVLLLTCFSGSWHCNLQWRIKWFRVFRFASFSCGSNATDLSLKTRLQICRFFVFLSHKKSVIYDIMKKNKNIFWHKLICISLKHCFYIASILRYLLECTSQLSFKILSYHCSLSWAEHMQLELLFFSSWESRNGNPQTC